MSSETNDVFGDHLRNIPPSEIEERFTEEELFECQHCGYRDAYGSDNEDGFLCRECTIALKPDVEIMDEKVNCIECGTETNLKHENGRWSCPRCFEGFVKEEVNEQ